MAMSSGLPLTLIEMGFGNATTVVPVVGVVPVPPGAVPVPEPVPVEEPVPVLDPVPVEPEAVVVAGAVSAFFAAPCPCPLFPFICPPAEALLPGPDVVAALPAGADVTGAPPALFGPPPLPPALDDPVDLGAPPFGALPDLPCASAAVVASATMAVAVANSRYGFMR